MYTRYSDSQTMKVNGLTCQFNMPNALKSSKDSAGNEVALGLPPYARQNAYAVDEYPACPTDWEHGSDKASSYFVGVEPGKGMWLDFNGCCEDTHDVAIVVSVQGVNSITGQKTDRMGLEQYREKCPKHDIPFQQDRFCPECKYKWPAQNYLATTGTPNGRLWLDGFRAADGIVRQYLFTEDEAKGVAAKKIGKDRVFAIGIAYYRSKDKKPQPEYTSRGRGVMLGGGACAYSEHVLGYCPPPSDGLKFTSNKLGDFYGGSDEQTLDACFDDIEVGDSGPATYSAESIKVKTASWGEGTSVPASASASGGTSCSSSAPMLNDTLKSIAPPPSAKCYMRSASPARFAKASVQQVTPVKKYEVAAGARIDQDVYLDPKELSYWEEQPAGFIYINYCDLETLQRIIAAGKRQESEEGFLSDVPVGNE